MNAATYQAIWFACIDDCLAESDAPPLSERERELIGVWFALGRGADHMARGLIARRALDGPLNDGRHTLAGT